MKIITQFEHKINDMEFQFQCHPNCPIALAKDALFQFISQVNALEETAKAQAEAAKASEPVAEEVKPETVGISFANLG